jgi:hypothetical protein
VDCHKGEKYGKSLLIDSRNAFDEQGEEQEQESTFDDYRDVEEEFVIGDNGPSLMVQRICLTPRKMEGDDGQRHNLFHSTRTIGGKVCKLIIDGGCYENVVVETPYTILLGVAQERKRGNSLKTLPCKFFNWH